MFRMALVNENIIVVFRCLFIHFRFETHVSFCTVTPEQKKELFKQD